jgi:hypothetical protein
MLSNGVKTTNKQSVALFSSLLSYSRVSNIQKRRDFLNCYQYKHQDTCGKQNTGFVAIRFLPARYQANPKLDSSLHQSAY